MKKIDKIKEILSERLEYEEIPVVWEFILEQKSEIDKLNDMINNPKDLTLCKMWADTKLQDEVERLNSIIIELSEKSRNLLEDNMRLRKEINLHSGKLYISDIEVKNVF